MEKCLSGRKYSIANRVYELISYRGFESLLLRNCYLYNSIPNRIAKIPVTKLVKSARNT